MHMLRLKGVKYEHYEIAIKRYGYTGRITEEPLKEIAPIINISPSALDDEFSRASKIFKSQKAFYQGTYKVEYLQILGYLFCYHESEDLAEEHLWAILDQDQMMIYYAMILPFEIQELEGINDHNYEDYVKQLKETGENYLKQAERKLPDFVYPETLRDIMPVQIWSTTYSIRENLLEQK
ncbi:UNKNOWN [Stylonychia lemnae]|uniref:Uncharacterized protein n=1 Tax=Stylonychia lemnae TaxID=5949 RepID=A0A078AI95_STYLE|nr:UNKNOWN [Stylonychia lemnae]|eukprot:CDW81929.1 UNKNOWN [Stylonychia lemnae]